MNKNDLTGNQAISIDRLEEKVTVDVVDKSVAKVASGETATTIKNDIPPTIESEKEWEDYSCPFCDYTTEGKKNPYNSLRMHVLGKSRYDPDHNVEEFNKLYPRDDLTKGKPRKRSIKTTGSVVQLEKVKGHHDPAESDKLIKLQKEIDVLKLENQRNALRKDSGYVEEEAEREERYSYQRDEREDTIDKKDRRIDDLMDKLMKEKDRNYKIQLENIKTSYEVKLEINDFKNEVDRKLDRRDEQKNNGDMSRAVNRLADVFIDSLEYNVKNQSGRPPLMNDPADKPDIEMNEDDVGILSSLKSNLVVEE